ncbi:hypothetical protein [Hymenobacter fastidiosus]|uniref:hypothetical protein n=1 Tax=Hymenobacter fastidiosus TaxID=486264 RepID=UPI0031E77583
MLRCCLWVVALLGVAGPARAQQPTRPVITDSARTQPEVRRDSLRRRFDQEKMLLGLKNYTRRKTIAGKAASALFNFTARSEDRAGLDAQLLDRQFDQHNYKIIRSVNISALDAFGYSISDPARQPKNILEKSANALHIKTVRSRVRQVLLFRVGVELQPQALAESERLLRQTPEILDARVFVNEATTDQDSVDIQIITKDIFSLGGSVQLRDVGAGIIALRDVNFLGQGHQFRNRVEYGRNEPQSWSYEGSYLVPFRQFVNAQATHRNLYQYRETGVVVSRGFYSVNTKYAGAAAFTMVDRGVTLREPPPGEPYVFEPLRYDVQDVWLGRALRLRSYDLGYENPGRVIVSARAINTNFMVRPNPTFVDNTLLLATVGYSVRRYYKDKYLFGFGRTEDIPTGTLLSLTTGYERSTAANRRYYALRASTAGYSVRSGYLYLSGEFGSYLRGRDNTWQQGLLNTELLYFTRLYHTGNWQWRHFFWNRSIIGFNRSPGEQLLAIDGERGLRGFQPTTNLRGTSRFVVNYEATVYTPVSFLGFRMAAVGFLDAAWLTTTPGRELPFRQTPYSGVGLGLRFRNEYTAIRTVQILLGFYPRGQNSPNGLRIFESSRPYYDFSDFSFAQPGLVRYE